MPGHRHDRAISAAILIARGLHTIYRHALAAFPEECCGMILESGVRPCENAANAIQQLDPERERRSARDAFCFNAADQVFLAESFGTTDPVRAVYHSHPNHDTAFSRLDIAAALWMGKGEEKEKGRPLYADLGHLVIGCRPGHITGAVLHGFVDGSYRPIQAFNGAKADEIALKSWAVSSGGSTSA